VLSSGQDLQVRREMCARSRVRRRCVLGPDARVSVAASAEFQLCRKSDAGSWHNFAAFGPLPTSARPAAAP